MKTRPLENACFSRFCHSFIRASFIPSEVDTWTNLVHYPCVHVVKTHSCYAYDFRWYCIYIILTNDNNITTAACDIITINFKLACVVSVSYFHGRFFHSRQVLKLCFCRCKTVSTVRKSAFCLS